MFLYHLIELAASVIGIGLLLVHVSALFFGKS